MTSPAASGTVEVPASLWEEVCAILTARTGPCRSCARGNLAECWHPQCASFPFRSAARQAERVEHPRMRVVPRALAVEEEILDILRREGRPVYPSCLVLETTRSRHNKHSAIDRLVRKGLVEEAWTNVYTRTLALTESGRAYCETIETVKGDQA